MADISERFSLGQIFLAAVLSSLIVTSCSTIKSDSMKLGDQERLAFVGLADSGSGAAAKKLSLHFGYGKYDEICFEQWQRMALFLDSDVVRQSEKRPEIIDKCRR